LICGFRFAILEASRREFLLGQLRPIENPNSKIKNGSALLLLVTWVLADHADNVLAFDDLAAFAKPFDGCSDFHGFFSL